MSAKPASQTSMTIRSHPAHHFLLTGLMLLMGSCANFDVAPFPEPIRPPKPAAEPSDTGAAAPAAQSGPKISPVPGVDITATQAAGLADQIGASLQGDPIRVAFNGVPIVAFINQVFGNELGMSFVISPGLQTKSDLVTLRLTEPVTPRQLFDTSRSLLREYGVSIREADGVLTFLATQEITSSDIPLLISGRTLPEVPATHRTVFQLVPLKVVRANRVSGLLKQAYPGSDLRIMDDSDRNNLLLMGQPDEVRQALSMLEVLDQPMLQGRYGVIVEPQYADVVELARALSKVLEAEGYQVSTGGPGGSSILLPLEVMNKLLIFSPDQQILNHITGWVRTLDEEQRETIEEALFTYEVQNTQAEEMVATLNKMIRGGSSESTAGGTEAQGRPGDRESEGNTGGGRIVVDKSRNLMIFRGSGREWSEILSVVEVLDKPVPSVLIEVLIAEITLNDEEGTGFEFLLRDDVGGDYGIEGGTLGALGLTERGLSMVLDSGGQTRAVLNLFYEENRVSIRSSPKLLVKSGEEASIEVGNEIPVITQLSDSGFQEDSDTSVLQEVTYRKTGVLLSIKPVVQASGLVDLEINQELSEAQPTAATSLEGSPTILNRTIKTSLTLKDGGSLLMGGLISNTQSSGETGVPGLAKIPLIGRLFRNDTYNGDRTELVVMVIPYVITDHEEGWRLTESVKQSLELHPEYQANP